jgi:hypothetical protein
MVRNLSIASALRAIKACNSSRAFSSGSSGIPA